MYLALRAMPKLGYKTMVAARHATAFKTRLVSRDGRLVRVYTRNKATQMGRRALLGILGSRRAAARLQKIVMPNMARVARNDAKRLGRATRAARIRLGHPPTSLGEILRGDWKGPVKDARTKTWVARFLRKRTNYKQVRPGRLAGRHERRRIVRVRKRFRARWEAAHPRLTRIENYARGFVRGIWPKRGPNPRGRKARKRGLVP